MPFINIATDYVSGTAPDAFGVGDLDGDGLSDIAIVNRGSDTLAIALQESGGHIHAAPAVTTYASNQRVGDFNGDGKPDLTESDGSGHIYLHANDGFGNFSSVSTVNGIATTVVVGDLNGDALPDLIFGTLDGRLGTGDCDESSRPSARERVYSTVR